MVLQARQQAGHTGSTSGDSITTNTIIIILVTVISFLAAVILACIWFFNRRAKKLRQRSEATKESAWREPVADVATPRLILNALQQNHRNSILSTATGHSLHDIEHDGGLDRNASIRSVVSLPPYSAAPREDEGVLGREGERAGMDTVVEFPETHEEEEDRREEEMESLFQIRQARRREQADREDRRRRRRAAREQGDLAALAALEEESRYAHRHRERNGSQALIVEHETRPRSRRVSMVSYASVGLARHDGSRVRASGDSDRPLIDAADNVVSAPLRPWVSRDSLRRSSSWTIHSYDTDNDSMWSDNDSDIDYLTPRRMRVRRGSSSRSLAQRRTMSLPRPGTNAGLPLTPVGSRNPLLQHRRSLHADVAASFNTQERLPPPYSGHAPTIQQRRGSAPSTMLEMSVSVPPPVPTLPDSPLCSPPSCVSSTTAPNSTVSGRRPSIPNFSMRRDSWVPPPPST